MDNSVIRFEIDETNITEQGNEETSLQTVEVEILPPLDISDERKVEIYKGISKLDERIDAISARVEELNSEIDSLTNHADGIDYAVAVASGILTGLLDSIFVGDYNPNIEDVVKDFANKKSKKPINSYEEAQKFLADTYHTKHDGAYISGKDAFGKSHHVNGHTHRMDDFTHHPTLLGLVMSILVRFLRVNLLFNKDGEGHLVGIKTDAKDILGTWGPAVLSGIMMWVANVAEQYAEDELDVEIPEPIKKIIKVVAVSPTIIEVLKCADEWYAHIISDVSTNKGIPGIFLSFLKELSALPILNKSGLPQVMQNIYNSKKMNFASELVMIEKLKKQAIPVIANELMVRGFYFVRHLITELQENKSLSDINWGKTIPIGNRTVERMITIASGTFMAFDIADAAIRSGGFNAACVLRINFVGVGRFAVAIGTDIGMGIKKSKKESERMILRGEQLQLLNAKVLYKEADMWIEAENTEKAIQETYIAMEKTATEFNNAWNEIKEGSKSRRESIEKIKKNDKKFADELSDLLEWGI